jgi:Fic family protein
MGAADSAKLQQRVAVLRSALGKSERRVAGTSLSGQTRTDIAALRQLVNALDPANDMRTYDELRERLIKARRALERRIAEKKAALDLQRPLSSPMVAKLYQDLRVRLTYHSNAIEGNSLDLSETQLVIEHGLTIGGHTVREHLEALHHAQAYSMLLELARTEAPIDETAISNLHALVMRDLIGTPGGTARAPCSSAGRSIARRTTRRCRS